MLKMEKIRMAKKLQSRVSPVRGTCITPFSSHCSSPSPYTPKTQAGKLGEEEA